MFPPPPRASYRAVVEFEGAILLNFSEKKNLSLCIIFYFIYSHRNVLFFLPLVGLDGGVRTHLER